MKFVVVTEQRKSSTKAFFKSVGERRRKIGRSDTGTLCCGFRHNLTLLAFGLVAARGLCGHVRDVGNAILYNFHFAGILSIPVTTAI